MNLYAAIQYLHPNAQLGPDFTLRDDSDGRGPYIETWNLDAPMPTAEELAAADIAAAKAQAIAANEAAIQAELDRQALAHGYDSILSASSYAAAPPDDPYQAEGAAFLAWRSAVWKKAIAVQADVEAGNIPMPTPEEAVAQMPALVLP